MTIGAPIKIYRRRRRVEFIGGGGVPAAAPTSGKNPNSLMHERKRLKYKSQDQTFHLCQAANCCQFGNLILRLRKVGARLGQGPGKVGARSGQKARFGQGLGRQGPGKVLLSQKDHEYHFKGVYLVLGSGFDCVRETLVPPTSAPVILIN